MEEFVKDNILVFEAEKVKLSSGILKDFVVCTAYLMSDGVNRNDSEFTLEALKNSKETFLYKPVLANVWTKINSQGKKIDYVGGHDFEVKKDEKGNEYASYKNGEHPVGVMTNESSFSIKKYKGRNFLVAKLFLWKQYNPELIKILAKDKNKKVSVEIQATDFDFYTDENGKQIKRINAFEGKGVTILGHRENWHGGVEEIQEGIADSHLELDENYVMAYSQAMTQNCKNAKDMNITFSNAEIRHSVIEELTNKLDSKELTLMSLRTEEDKVEGKYFFNGALYSFEGEVNLDGSIELTTEEKINSENCLDIYSQFINNENNIKQPLECNAVNLVDEIDNYDIYQLIYKIFTYCNSEKLTKLTFGAIEKGWIEKPFGNLKQPFATIGENEITFSLKELSCLTKERLELLKQEIENEPLFYEVTNVVKGLIEKYETEETQKMENMEDKIEDSTIEQAETNFEENFEASEPKEDAIETEKCGDKENMGVQPEAEPVEENACGNPEEEKHFEENAEENKEEDKIDEEAQEEVDKESCTDEMKDKELEALKQENESLKAEFAALKENYDNLELQFEQANNALREKVQVIEDMKFEAFMKNVDNELETSILSNEDKDEVRKLASESRFSSIVDVQKEIAFLEKKNKKDSFAFSVNLENKRKIEEPKNKYASLLNSVRKR